MRAPAASNPGARPLFSALAGAFHIHSFDLADLGHEVRGVVSSHVLDRGPDRVDRGISGVVAACLPRGGVQEPDGPRRGRLAAAEALRSRIRPRPRPRRRRPSGASQRHRARTALRSCRCARLRSATVSSHPPAPPVRRVQGPLRVRCYRCPPEGRSPSRVRALSGLRERLHLELRREPPRGSSNRCGITRHRPLMLENASAVIYAGRGWPRFGSPCLRFASRASGGRCWSDARRASPRLANHVSR